MSVEKIFILAYSLLYTLAEDESPCGCGVHSGCAELPSTAQPGCESRISHHHYTERRGLRYNLIHI